MIEVILIFCVALMITAFAIPRIIVLAQLKNLFDDPKDKRKVHKNNIPALGGVAIFMGILLSQTLLIDPLTIPNNHLIFGAIILFMVGLKDDLTGIDPGKKFIAQFLVAFVIAYYGDIRFISLGHFLTITELPTLLSLILSVLFIVGLINAYNLMDGIDGLSGSQGLILSTTFGLLFYFAGETGWAMLSMAIAGALMAFLWFNISPAKIFMGDSGALLIGFYAAVSCIAFVDIAMSETLQIGNTPIVAPYGIISALIMIPVFDTIRVFTLRILKNGSPFKADRNHFHHRLLDLGLSHTRASLGMALLTITFLAIAFYAQALGNTIVVLGLYSLMFTINLILFLLERKQKQEVLN